MSELNPLSVYEVLSNPLTARVFSRIGVVMNHLYVREERLLAGEPMDDLQLREELDAMATVPDVQGLDREAECILLLALALDFCDDARTVVAGVCPWAPYACLHSMAMLLNLDESEVPDYERQLAPNGELARRNLIQLRPRPGSVMRIPNRHNLRTAFIDITGEGINLLMGVSDSEELNEAAPTDPAQGHLRLLK